MPDPISYTSTTPRYALPLLYPGQSQKEAFVNAALALADLLLHPAILGEATDPPASPVEGETWLVAASATGAWVNHDNDLASFQSGSWAFASPSDGLQLLDLSTGQMVRYLNGWQRPTAPASPAGGTTVDSEARTAIAGMIDALKNAGIFASV
ncbi:DUF2793 domain-containing protein [Tsuneonella mangrovi]|uniref:DUF2793 domain-containing protein n=1 Tax=Tsuneonella mangrovi TaxID=1982042 RepID=UPI000BA1CFDC|nr:DUF2793 domain-containing protein [Tsuneonella mangrovi]